MEKYIKNGIIYNTVNLIVLNGRQIINPKKEDILIAGYEVYTESELSDEEVLENAIEIKIEELNSYADNDNLNSYIAQDVTIRLPLELRLRLRNVIDAKIALGESGLTEWYEGVSYTYPLSAWDTQLTQYENYLYEVACNTEQHKQNIKKLTSVSDVNSYDYTTGYPTQLNFGTYSG